MERFVTTAENAISKVFSCYGNNLVCVPQHQWGQLDLYSSSACHAHRHRSSILLIVYSLLPHAGLYNQEEAPVVELFNDVP